MSTGHRGVAFSWSFLPRPPGRVARDPRVRVERGGRAVDLREHPRHLRRAEPAGPRRVRMVQETDDKEARAEERSDRADDDGLRNAALARVGEEEGIEEHERSGDEQEHPERSRDGAPARAHAVETRLLACGRLIEPLLVCRLFRGRRRPSGLKGPKEWDAPRVEPRLAACRSEERRVGKSVDLGGRRIIEKKKKRKRVTGVVETTTLVLTQRDETRQ